MKQGDAAGLFAELAQAGFLAPIQADPRHGGRSSWHILPGRSEGEFEHDGRCYLPLDVSRLPPFYQETYHDIVIRRLGRAGFGEGTGVACNNGLVLAWVPAPAMRECRPSLVALRRLCEGDEAWVDELDWELHDAAHNMEQRADDLWAELVEGRVSCGALLALLNAKVALNALALDTLVPPPKLLDSWIAPYVAPALVAEVVDGCLQPASGYVAYDVYEDECWRLAQSSLRLGYVAEPARRRFVQRALFFQFESLDTSRKSYHFEDYPSEVAVRFAAITARGEVAARRDAIRERNWRRRFHRSWAYELIRSTEEEAVGRRLMTVHRFLGVARDFDEEKRRLNFKLWRNLVALADALDVPLPTASREDLYTALERSAGKVAVDPVLTQDPAGDDEE